MNATSKKNKYFKKTFAPEIKEVGIKKIPINIWDDYYEDGYVPKGEKQETYAYVESNLLGNELIDDVLHFLMDEIEKFAIPKLKLKVSQEPVNLGPFMIVDGVPRLFFTNITHAQREAMVKTLVKMKLQYEGAKLDIYSES